MSRRFAPGAALVCTVLVGACAAPRQVPAQGAVLFTSTIRTQPGEMPVVPRTLEPVMARPRGGGSEDVASFEAEVQSRLRRVEAALREDVERGVLSPEALDVVAARSRAVRAAVREAVADGVIARREQRLVDALLAQMVTDSYQEPVIHGAWPGGARYWR
jgi:hypothetical protein